MKLKLPEGKFGAYLFDCDGTIVDSMPLHYQAWKKALAEWNCEFSEAQFYAWGGMPVAEVISTLNLERGLQMPVDELEQLVADYPTDLLNSPPQDLEARVVFAPAPSLVAMSGVLYGAKRRIWSDVEH